ncbi:carboxylesterase/lipase family protein [Caulobacter sp.]|uniref:carboxylesterase/lipase family protein n=1 Tax=Caulobacter sp. TaxID=78 RepID=UPI003BA8EF71
MIGPSNLKGVSRRAVFTGGVGLATASAVAFASPTASAASASQALVSTPGDLVAPTISGKVRGYRSSGISIFKGIPYGADTGGQARFLPPKPPMPWADARLAVSYGPICPQERQTGAESQIASFLMPKDDGVHGEDCLRLNVWTPAADIRRRPVMVWIHGGQYSAGSSQAHRSQDGEALARRGDAVVVSLNHRLNVLGYLNALGLTDDKDFAHPNAGMLDIIAALEWVRDNITAFGGDPGNVTLFGQSGGGLKISVLMAMPAARGLFHKGIVQSGSQPHVFKAADTERVAAEFLKAMGISGRDLSVLKTAPIEQLMAAEAVARAKIMRFPLSGQALWTTVGWAPSIDGTSIPRDTHDGPPVVDAALLIGSTQHEFNPAVFMPKLAPATDADLLAALTRSYGGRADSILKLFRERHPYEAPARLSAIISSAGFNRANAVEQAQLHARAGGQAWLYRFDWQTPVLDATPGAYHCAEIPLVFHNAQLCATSTGGGPRAETMADLMADTWIAFARHGKPTHAALPAWPAVTPTTAPTMALDDRSRLADDDSVERAAVAGV